VGLDIEQDCAISKDDNNDGARSSAMAPKLLIRPSDDILFPCNEPNCTPTMMSHNDIEGDPIRIGIEKDIAGDEEHHHDQLPTVDQILVDRGQGKVLSESTLDEADDPSDPH